LVELRRKTLSLEDVFINLTGREQVSGNEGVRHA